SSSNLILLSIFAKTRKSFYNVPMNHQNSLHRHCRLEKELTRLHQRCQDTPLSFAEIISEVGHHDQALVTLILALPFLLPIPLPGLSIPFGIVIALVSIRMFFGLSFWLPSFLKKKTLDPELGAKLFSRAIPLAHRLSSWVKPRGKFFLDHLGTRRISTLLITFCGILLALPLPPGTNAPPALTIVLLSLGVLEHDGLYLALGYLCFFLIVTLFVTIGFWGYPHVLHWFGS
ncbi:MAG: exopolysaccharide biosynthesis protein, partial [Proteobacteria bacterium]|nr:exopolysaccharide biosynthesis protein [Pseudomonadota bacterium]